MASDRIVRPARAVALLTLLAAVAPAAPGVAQAAKPASPGAADTTRAAPAAPQAPRTLLGAPAGDTLGALHPDAPMEVVGREGEWARVRVEGWVRVPPGTALGPAGPLGNLSLRALRSDPERYRGRSVTWEVQFIALQTADSLRVDLVPGERYMLVRDPDGEPGFVYVAVPPALAAAVRGLGPLQRVRIVGRVRTGRSGLTGHPVLELTELRN